MQIGLPEFLVVLTLGGFLADPGGGWNVGACHAAPDSLGTGRDSPEARRHGSIGPAAEARNARP